MEERKKKIVCIHLLNDFSGSPKVLAQLAVRFIEAGHPVDIFTANPNGKGFLSAVTKANHHSFFYRWSKWKLLTLFFLLLSQCILFFKLLRYAKRDVVFYVNTVLPFGAALAGKVLNKEVIYHVHESSIKPLIFKNFLFWIASKTASNAIYVSKFLLQRERIPKVGAHLIYNALTEEFVEKGKASTPQHAAPFLVLMLCSLKEYKGVQEYLSLARRMDGIQFELVLNAQQDEIDLFFKGERLPSNLTLFPSQQNVHPFYQRANLVLNLSHPLKWVETFGMTALEAMCYGLPVIVPEVGGIAELVEDEINGYKIDVRNVETLEQRILELSTNVELYHQLSQGARIKTKEFSLDRMSLQALRLVH